MATTTETAATVHAVAGPRIAFKHTAQAIEFYKAAFGAKEILRFAIGDQIPHAELAIGDSSIYLADEWPEGGRFPEDIVARGDTSPAALRVKARWVLDMIEQRLRGLGATWDDTTATQAYTVHDLHPFLGGEIVARGAAPAGLTWHYCRPPISGLEYEMDARGVALERVIRA